MLENWLMSQLNEKTVMITSFNKTALRLTTKTCKGISIETCHKGG